jgi:hypothetical protein
MNEEEVLGRVTSAVEIDSLHPNYQKILEVICNDPSLEKLTKNDHQ